MSILNRAVLPITRPAAHINTCMDPLRYTCLCSLASGLLAYYHSDPKIIYLFFGGVVSQGPGSGRWPPLPVAVSSRLWRRAAARTTWG